MSARRIATVDIGTQSVLFLAVEQRAGRVEVLAQRQEITRLGRGVDATGRLSGEALAETFAVLDAFAQQARALGCEGPYATATSAARDAANGHLLLEGAALLGLSLEIISGDREAQLAYRSVAEDHPADAVLAVVDIGGGSTEIIRGRGTRLDGRRSFDLGSVRLSERLLRSDPPRVEELEALEHTLKMGFEPLRAEPLGAGAASEEVVGIAGSFTTLAALQLGLVEWDAARVHGLRLSRAQLEGWARRLAALPVEERRRLPGLPAKRAEAIVAGAFIAVAALDALGADSVGVGVKGVRWGLLYERLEAGA